MTVDEREMGVNSVPRKDFVSKFGSKSLVTRLVAACLLLMLTAQASASMLQKSVTVDEITYIAAGYYHVRTGDFQMNMTNPPLAKMLSAIPLLLLEPDIPNITTNPANWNQIEEWQYAREFLYKNSVDADTMLFVARMPVILIAVILGLYLYIWSSRLYGGLAGLLALFLFSFSPNILAHTRLATQDLILTAFMFISAYYFWKYSNRMRTVDLFLCGLFFGLSVITKSVGLFLLPIFGIYGLILLFFKRDRLFDVNLPIVKHISEERPKLRKFTFLVLSLLLIGITGLIVINIGYGFQGSFQPISSEIQTKVHEKLPLDLPVVGPLVDLGLNLPIPFPTAYVKSIFFQFKLASNSGNVFFAGNYYPDGLWYLMPVSFLLKTPLPTVILFALSLIFLVAFREHLDAELLNLVFISFVLLIFTFLSKLNVGVRYILPVYPFVFLLISRLLSLDFKRPKLASGILFFLSAWYLIGALSIYPHYLSYFNEIVGGPANGYRYLADSNVDWGQDLKALKRYMDERGIDKIKLGYFGSADADYYDIDYEYLPSVGLAPQESGQYWWYEIDSVEKTRLAPQTGTIAVSSNILTSPGWMHGLFSESYAWLREHKPVDQVGYSILIYEIEE